MRTTTTLLLAIPLTLAAQTTHFVEVGGSTLGPTPPYYSPDLLTIQVGDIVTWENESGTHNVDGGTFFFPGNPVPFGSGEPDNGDWTYSFTFNVAGTYNYSCNTEGHSATQEGRIIVLEANSVAENQRETPFSISPTPASDHLYVELGARTIARFEVLGMDGRILASHAGSSGRLARIPVAELPQGNYLLRIVETAGKATSLRFSKN